MFPKIKNSLALLLAALVAPLVGVSLAQADASSSPAVASHTQSSVVVRQPSTVTTVAEVKAVTKTAAPVVTYKVVSGDTLSAISLKYYNDASDYPAIVSANHIANPNLIFPNQVFVIPANAEGGTLTVVTPPKSPAPSHVPTATKSSSGYAPPSHVSYGSPQAIAKSLMSASDFGCFNYIITRESGWDVYATNPSSGAYGLPQALPGWKMASAGADWRTNPLTQIRWAIGYMRGSYGSICGAAAFWANHHWY